MAPMSVILMHGEAQEEATDFCNEAFLVPKPHKNLDPKLVFDYIKSLVDSSLASTMGRKFLILNSFFKIRLCISTINERPI